MGNFIARVRDKRSHGNTTDIEPPSQQEKLRPAKGEGSLAGRLPLFTGHRAENNAKDLKSVFKLSDKEKSVTIEPSRSDQQEISRDFGIRKERLPDHVLGHVFSYLPIRDLADVALVSRQYERVTHAPLQAAKLDRDIKRIFAGK
ncbi:conserved hypothetical protein, partial [Ricinus communis]